MVQRQAGLDFSRTFSPVGNRQVDLGFQGQIASSFANISNQLFSAASQLASQSFAKSERESATASQRDLQDERFKQQKTLESFRFLAGEVTGAIQENPELRAQGLQTLTELQQADPEKFPEVIKGFFDATINELKTEDGPPPAPPKPGQVTEPGKTGLRGQPVTVSEFLASKADKARLRKDLEDGLQLGSIFSKTATPVINRIAQGDIGALSELGTQIDGLSAAMEKFAEVSPGLAQTMAPFIDSIEQQGTNAVRQFFSDAGVVDPNDPSVAQFLGAARGVFGDAFGAPTTPPPPSDPVPGAPTPSPEGDQAEQPTTGAARQPSQIGPLDIASEVQAEVQAPVVARGLASVGEEGLRQGAEFLNDPATNLALQGPSGIVSLIAAGGAALFSSKQKEISGREISQAISSGKADSPNLSEDQRLAASVEDEAARKFAARATEAAIKGETISGEEDIGQIIENMNELRTAGVSDDYLKTLLTAFGFPPEFFFAPRTQ